MSRTFAKSNSSRELRIFVSVNFLVRRDGIKIERIDILYHRKRNRVKFHFHLSFKLASRHEEKSYRTCRKYFY